ncbi:hypothetical protein DFP72DRAFT_642851 [Ephemerocybe angulata]|uniref:Uncharacterized protein n=1 Tax=Ephemerocybe angulata TaxID=980116 RepID=A0A8H6HEZ6_9AGAR|nr:hypothetical protein DFP72DRAFT_642851 [Tulosesus angulatus]
MSEPAQLNHHRPHHTRLLFRRVRHASHMCVTQRGHCASVIARIVRMTFLRRTNPTAPSTLSVRRVPVRWCQPGTDMWALRRQEPVDILIQHTSRSSSGHPASQNKCSLRLRNVHRSQMAEVPRSSSRSVPHIASNLHLPHTGSRSIPHLIPRHSSPAYPTGCTSTPDLTPIPYRHRDRPHPHPHPRASPSEANPTHHPLSSIFCVPIVQLRHRTPAMPPSGSRHDIHVHSHTLLHPILSTNPPSPPSVLDPSSIGDSHSPPSHVLHASPSHSYTTKTHFQRQRRRLPPARTDCSCPMSV